MSESVNVEQRDMNWFGRLFPRSRSLGRRPLNRDELHFALNRERARSDRSGDEFSAILLTGNPATGPDMGDHLADFLPERLRVTDDFGTIERHRWLVILPDTRPEGAWKVADDILASLDGAQLPHAQCDVFVYPGGWEDEGTDSEETWVAHDRPVFTMEPLFCEALPRWKRCIDVVMATTGLIVAAPVMGLVALAIKSTSPGPILFRQHRSGIGGRAFKMLKFRTMVDGAESARDDLLEFNEQDGPAFKIKNDPRITRLGALLRKTSLDELPQLWNVLQGHMSLVGPRPLPCHESDACTPWQRRRMDVTPGLTCTWQIEGRSRVTFDEWARMDVRYVRDRSPWHDLKLIARTAHALLTRSDGC